MQSGTLIDDLPQAVGAETPLPATRDEGHMHRTVGTHNDGDTGHAFAANDADFDAGSAGAVGHHRGEAALQSLRLP